MNAASRRALRRWAVEVAQLRELHGDPDWSCPSCGASDGTIIEVCLEHAGGTMCPPRQVCAGCGVEVE